MSDIGQIRDDAIELTRMQLRDALTHPEGLPVLVLMSSQEVTPTELENMIYQCMWYLQETQTEDDEDAA